MITCSNPSFLRCGGTLASGEAGGNGAAGSSGPNGAGGSGGSAAASSIAGGLLTSTAVPGGAGRAGGASGQGHYLLFFYFIKSFTFIHFYYPVWNAKNNSMDMRNNYSIVIIRLSVHIWCYQSPKNILWNYLLKDLWTFYEQLLCVAHICRKIVLMMLVVLETYSDILSPTMSFTRLV